jgi:flagellar basal-body rod protein FlgG
MIEGIYTSVAGALVNKARVGVIANNLANANTTGYKKDVSVFQRRLSEMRENPEMQVYANKKLEHVGGGIYLTENWTNLRQQGTHIQTGNPLDLAIKGPGFFVVQDAEGEQLRYTRAGNFQVNQNGYITTRDGKWFLTDDASSRISLGENGSIEIDSNRSFKINGEIVGKIQVVDFETKDLKYLQKEGDNLFRTIADIESVDFQGESIFVSTLEGSNVSTVEEMVEMINSQRHYEMNMNLIKIQDKTIGQAINEVGSVPV